MQFSSYYIRQSLDMKISDIISIGDGVYQLEKGNGSWDPDICEEVVLRLAGIETDLTYEQIEEEAEVL